MLTILLTASLAMIVVIGGAVGVFGVAAIAAVGALSTDLPDPATLEQLTFAQPTVIYDRTGKVQLARFQKEQRRVVAFSDVPKFVIDATTTAEDRTFWQNGGFDPAAIVSAVAESARGAGDRGASTITQQLVRARLLPAAYIAPGADRYVRKAKELIQSARVTEAFPGEAGKQRIMAAYLNQIFYGHDAYGIAAAALIYFGVRDLDKLTLAQAALLAALPKSPTTLDPYRYAKPDKQGRLVVPSTGPSTAPAVIRRNYILSNLSTSRWTRPTPAQLAKALEEPVILAGEQAVEFRAPHFVWQVRRQLETILGSAEKVDTGGYRVVTTLDWEGQQLAEKWLAAGVIAPNLSRSAARKLLDDANIPASDRLWINALRGKDLHDAALVAVDYRTGDVLAYSGSAGYYRNDLRSTKFAPNFDAAGDGTRQPGSAFKPIMYATAFDQHVLTPGSLLLDISTQFGPKYAPHDADQLERGPVLVRKALQYSLNLPALRAIQRVGNEAVADEAAKMGIRFAGGRDAFLNSGLTGAIGTVELRPIDLTAAYGTIANGGQYVAPRMILEIDGPDGKVVWRAPQLAPKQVLSPQAAFLVTDILQGNTDPAQNPIWSAKLELLTGPGGSRRPAAVKTGTANDAIDLATYGFLPPPQTQAQPGLAVGIWMGNSDHTKPQAPQPATSLTAAAPLWHAFVRDYSRKWPVTVFRQPDGVVAATIDAWTGGPPGPWTINTTTEYFIAGTQPGGHAQVDPAGLLYSPACGGWRVDPLKAELGPARWNIDVADWLARARRGPGVTGKLQSTTAYFWGRTSWGGTLLGPCVARRTSYFTHRVSGLGTRGRPVRRRHHRGQGGGGNGGGGNQGGGGGNGQGTGTTGTGAGTGAPPPPPNGGPVPTPAPRPAPSAAP